MIYFVTALSFEAKPIIEHFSMKCIVSDGAYRIYQSESAILGISGVGEFNGATLVGIMCTMRKPTKNDILVNFGICGAVSSALNIGDFVRVQEVVYGLERPLILDAFAGANDSEKLLSIPEDILDMEAYGVAFAGLKFFTCDRVFIYKVVSDIAKETAEKEGGKIDKNLAVTVINEGAEKLFGYLTNIEKFYQTENDDSFVFSSEEIDRINKIGEDLKLSFQDKEILKNHFRKMKYLGKQVSFDPEPVKDRRQGEILLKKLVASDV